MALISRKIQSDAMLFATGDEIMASTPGLKAEQDLFMQKMVEILEHGKRDGISKDHVVDQLYHLAHDNPEIAKASGFPLTHLEIKNGLVIPWFGNTVSNTTVSNEKPIFEIVIDEKGKKDGETYGATMYLRSGDGRGKVLTVPVSTWPNPKNGNPGIKEGTYPSVYKNNGHKQNKPNPKPGVRLRDGGKISTIGPNPNQNGNLYADGINLHCGDSKNNRGSIGCITIQPDHCDEVWNALEHDSVGTVTVERKNEK